MAGRFDIETIFSAKDRMTGPVRKLRTKINQFTRSAKKGFRQLNRMVDKFGQNLRKAGQVGAVGLAALGAGAFNIIKTGAQFEQKLVGAFAKFGLKKDTKEGLEAFQALEKQARKTGAETEFSASQAAEGLNFLAMAGFNAKQAVAALPAVVDLATAAGVELGTASDIATDSLGAFGLATKDPVQLQKNLARVMDSMAKTATSANTNMEMMMETIKQGGPVATSVGGSLEQFLALTGELANAGIKGSDAGTTLKNVYLRLAAPVDKAADTLKELGVKTKDSAGNLRDVTEILGDLKKSLAGKGDAEQQEKLFKIFGKIPIAGVNILLKSGTKRMQEYTKEIENANGATAEMAALMRDTVQGRINGMNSAFEGLKITLFKLNDTALGGFIERITEKIRAVDAAIGKDKELGRTITNDIINTVTAAIKAFSLFLAIVIAAKTAILAFNFTLVAFNTLLLFSKAIIFAFNAVMIVFNLIMGLAKIGVMLFNVALWLNPIGAIVAAVIIFIGVLALLVTKWKSISGFFKSLWAGIITTFDSAVAKVSALMEIIANPFKNLFTGVMKLRAALGIEGGDDTQQVGAAAQTAGAGAKDQIDININDSTGTAEVANGPSLDNIGLNLQQSGGL